MIVLGWRVRDRPLLGAFQRQAVIGVCAGAVVGGTENGDGGLLFVEAWQRTPTLPKRPVGCMDVEVVMDAEVVN
jgi:hypothetical protein